MNLSEVKKLKDGDKIEFVLSFRPFTVGKKYKVPGNKTQNSKRKSQNYSLKFKSF